MALIGPQPIRFLGGNNDPDGDGVIVSVEVANGTNPVDDDTDDDGVLDGFDNCPLTPNTDQADAVQPNGIGDACEDSDGDGVSDADDNCPTIANPSQRDRVRLNGVGDACEDSDADGLVDAIDVCGLVADPNQIDSDGDGAGDACDSCLETPNPDQREETACFSTQANAGSCLAVDVEPLHPSTPSRVRLIGRDSSGLDQVALEAYAGAGQIVDLSAFDDGEIAICFEPSALSAAEPQAMARQNDVLAAIDLSSYASTPLFQPVSPLLRCDLARGGNLGYFVSGGFLNALDLSQRPATQSRVELETPSNLVKVSLDRNLAITFSGGELVVSDLTSGAELSRAGFPGAFMDFCDDQTVVNSDVASGFSGAASLSVGDIDVNGGVIPRATTTHDEGSVECSPYGPAALVTPSGLPELTTLSTSPFAYTDTVTLPGVAVPRRIAFAEDAVFFSHDGGIGRVPFDASTARFTGPIVANFATFGGTVEAMYLGPFGQRLHVLSATDVTLFDVRSGEQVAVIQPSTTPFEPQCVPEPNYFDCIVLDKQGQQGLAINQAIGPDADGDGLADLCDNCPQTSNLEQSDLDQDGEGDRCDTDDGRVVIAGIAGGLLDWDDEGGPTGFNLYRGDLAALADSGIYTQAPGSNPNAAQFCGLGGSQFDDGFLPQVGSPAFYLAESSPAATGIGFDSAGGARPNTAPCP